MSVSGRMNKYDSKNYNITLTGEDKKDMKIKIQPWTRVYELKSKLSKEFGIETKFIRLFFCNIEMIDDLTMLDYKILDTKKPEIFYKIVDIKDNNDKYIQIYGTFSVFFCPQNLRDIIEEVKYGFIQGLVPVLIHDGTSGTYNLRNTNKDTVALFKPIDEEAFAPNNQKGYTGKFGQETFRKGILSGEGSIREVAAYLIDKNNYFDVPETTFVEMSHPTFNKNNNELFTIEHESFPKMRNSIIHNFVLENLVNSGNNSSFHNTSANTMKMSYDSNSSFIVNTSNSVKKKYGSLQRFIHADDVAANFSCTLFDTKNVHKIGILDIRILNCDRNDENILVVKKKDSHNNKIYKLIPIDHSLSFPDCLKISEYEMSWMGWDQAKKPFCKEHLEYIKNINILEDMERISQCIKLRDKCWKLYRLSNLVLKKCAENGLTLYEIGMLLYRPGFEETPSEIEMLIDKSDKLYLLYAKSDISSKINNSNFNEEYIELTAVKYYSKKDEEEKEVIQEGGRKKSLLKRSTSEPNLKKYENKENELEIDYTKNLDYLDDPYNEAYFYIFENVLSEFLKTKEKIA